MRRNTRPAFGARPAYYGHVARGYDLVARTYDSVEGRNAISERVRHAARRAALRSFPQGSHVLELGCGTGRDAVFFGRRGIRVTAVDVSPAMASVALDRAAREGVENLVTVRVQAAAEACADGGLYDGAYSNGAVLNLEPNLRGLAEGLAEVIRPGGKAIVTAANRLSLFELLIYPFALRPRKAFRKLGDAVPIPVSREGAGAKYVLPTVFYTPREFLGFFHEAFELESCRSLQAVTPPWNMVDWSTTFREAIAILERIEDRLGETPGLRSLGAIYLMTLRRRGG